MFYALHGASYARTCINYMLYFSTRPRDCLSLLAYGYVDYSMCHDTLRSISRMVTLASGTPIDVSSKRSTSVLFYITEVEYYVGSAASLYLSWLVRMVIKLHISLTNETYVHKDGSKTTIVTFFVDNKGAVDIANGCGPTKVTRHMEVRTMLLQEQVQKGTLLVKQISTISQLTDCMTKPLDPVKIHQVLFALNSTEHPAGRVVVLKTTNYGTPRRGCPQTFTITQNGNAV